MGLVKGQKLKILTLGQKATVIERLKAGMSVTACAKEFQVSKGTICNIKRQARNITVRIATTYTGPGKMRTMKKAENPKTEKALYKWFLDQRKRNMPINGSLIREKAKQLYILHEGRHGGVFNASPGWLQKWKRRHGIRLLTISGEKLAANPGLVDPFKKRLKDKISELGLTTEQVYNVDETALFWKMLPKKTYVSVSEKRAPGGKTPKQRISLLLGSNAAGTHKLTPLIIGKAKNPRPFKNFTMPVEYKNSVSAWMTSFIFKEWFHKSFVPQVKQHLREKHLPQKALLIIDNAPCHPSEEELKTENSEIFTMFLPPNVTSLIQPMDQNGIRITKLHYKSSLLSAIFAENNNNLLAAIKKINLRDVVTLVAKSWEKVTPEVLQKCWKPLLEDENQFSSEDDIPLSILRQRLRENHPDGREECSQIISLLREIDDQNYTEADVNEWLSEEYQENPAEDIDTSNSESDSCNENSCLVSNTLSDKEAINVFNKAIQWAGENQCGYSELSVLQKLRETAVQNMLNKAKQLKISNFFQKKS